MDYKFLPVPIEEFRSVESVISACRVLNNAYNTISFRDQEKEKAMSEKGNVLTYFFVILLYYYYF